MAKKDTHVEKPDITASEIYEGGSLTEVKIGDLLGNEVAIRMVLNDLNKKNKEIFDYQNKIKELDDNISSLRLTPLIQKVCICFNAAAAIVMAIGTNILSVHLIAAIGLIVIGGLLLIVASVFPFLLKKYK